MMIRIKKHILIGIAASIFLLLIYSVVLVLLQGSKHALEQTAKVWYWLLILALSFGTQMSLFSFLRQVIRARKAAAVTSVATSGGISAGSMVACCAHHLTEVLPFIGLASLTTFLATYQVFFMVIGILANFIGITIMLENIQRLGRFKKLDQFRFNMRFVKKLTIVSSIVIGTVTLFLITAR